jgi:NitT/TauT family transport system permease protein
MKAKSDFRQQPSSLRRGLRWLQTNAAPIIAFAVVFLAWEAAYRLLHPPDYLLPGPSVILREFLARWLSVALAAWATSQQLIVGYLIAVAVSVPLAMAIAFSPFLQTVVYPLIVFLQIIPKIAVAPLFIIWFGFGFLPKVLLVFLLSFFPIVLSGVAGFASVEPDIMDLARSTGANPLRIFWMIRLPHALPSIFTGLKVGAALSATAAVVAEFVASDRGLGYLLLQYNADMNTAMTFAIVIVLSGIGLAVYFLVELAEQLAIPWHVSQRTKEPDVNLV